MNKIIFHDVRDCNLEHIFQCGQCFRWEPVTADTTLSTHENISNDCIQRYVGIANKYAALVEYDLESKDLKVTGSGSEEFWRSYFDLERDYSKIKNTLILNDDTIEEAIKFGDGIRILNQDLWETILSFIISQNNNIPRIKGCINNLSRHFGEEIPGSREIGSLINADFKPCSLPSPEKIAELDVEDLNPIRLGYRAKYIVNSAKQVLERGMPQTYDDLLELTGVGPKVANCIALFGLSKRESFPIDVWVRRVMNHVYGLPEDDFKAISDFASSNFGTLGGYAQQYLFYYMREMGNKKL